MFLKMGAELYASRIVLNVLGVKDYGIYSVVGGVVVLFGFFNAAMTTATERFLAFDIGRNENEKLRNTFNATVIIHICIALLVLLLAETIGLWFVMNKLNVPEARMDAVFWVYQFSIFTFLVTVLQVPFNALIIAREEMNVYAMLSIAEVILKLFAVFLLTVVAFDKLTLYAGLLFLLATLIALCYRIYCLKNFEESKFKWFYDKEYFVSLISYSGWNLFGNIAVVAKGQGTNMLLNIFFGTVVNAAYGITMQVQGAVNTFVVSFQTAANPQIYKTFAQGDIAQMQKLMFQVSKFSYFVLFILVCPIIYNIDFILKWWLENPPVYASIFITLTLSNLLIETISQALITGALATGKIKWYQIVVGLTLCLNLPLNYIVFKFIPDPVMYIYVAILLSVVTLFLRLRFLKSMISLDVMRFFKDVLFPVISITAICGGLIYLLYYFNITSASFLELILVSALIVVLCLIVIVLVGLKKSEKAMIKSLITNRIKK